jgi:hypothetical protein
VKVPAKRAFLPGEGSKPGINSSSTADHAGKRAVTQGPCGAKVLRVAARTRV